MVTLTARQSVILKCNMKASILLGNYEFYYGAGLFAKIAGVEVSLEFRPKELYDGISEHLQKFKSGDERENYLAQLLKGYRPNDAYDGQMKELLAWGLSEEKMWQAH